MTVGPQALPLAPAALTPPGHLMRRTRALAWLGLGWHLVEAAVAIAAGVVARSVALVGFGDDAPIEALAGLVIIWLVAGAALSEALESWRGDSCA